MTPILMFTMLKNAIEGRETSRQSSMDHELPTLTPPSIREVPLPKPSTCSYTYRPNVRLIGSIATSFLAIAILALTCSNDIANENVKSFLVVIGGLCAPGTLFSSMIWWQSRKILYCIGTDGLISRFPNRPPLTARWVDIAKIGNQFSTLDIELWDRTTYLVRCPKAGRKETTRCIRAFLDSDRYSKAEHLLRTWEMED